MKGFLVLVLLSHGAVEALADGGLVLSIGQMLSCLPVSAALCLPLCWTQQVETGRECLVERFGRYHRRLTPGWHLVCSPFETVSMRGSLREQVLDIPSQQCYTRDNAPIMADAVVYLRILDLKTACYEVEDVFHAIRQICLTQLREEIGKLTLDDTFSSREHLGKTLLSDLNGVTMNWGVQITRIELQELQPSRTIKDAMELQLAAERRKRAAILQSEGERTTLTNEAEGRASALVADATAKREASILAAQGEAERLRLQATGTKTAIETVAQALADARGKDKTMEAALQLLMFDRYMETQAKFAMGNNSKVLMFPTKDSIPLAHESLRGVFPLE